MKYAYEIVLFLFFIPLTSCSSEDDTRSNETSVEDLNLVQSYYSITCCRDGYPEPDPGLAPQIRHWTQELAGTVPSEGNSTCNRYIGHYSLPAGWVPKDRHVPIGVNCRCTEAHLDRNCRYLPDCENSGYRSFSINLRCVCPPQYFGDLCEKYCLNGDLIKDERTIDHCVCRKFFYGDSCQYITCFNGGTPVNGRGCSCMAPFVGLHCEMGGSGMSPEDQQSARHSDSLQRNLSGSAVCAFLAVSVGLVLYFLIRRRRRMLRRRTAIVQTVMGPNGEFTVDSTYNPGAPPPPQSYDLSSFPPLPAYRDVVKSAPPAYIVNRNNPTTDGDSAPPTHPPSFESINEIPTSNVVASTQPLQRDSADSK